MKSEEAHKKSTRIREPANHQKRTLAALQENTEKNLKESEERFRLLCEAAEEGIAIHDNGFIVDANQALARMYGYELHEMIGMYGEKIFTPQSWKIIKEHIAAGDGKPYEGTQVRKDGSTFECSMVGKPYKYKDRTLRVVTFRDITERKKAEAVLKRSEAKYRSIFENAMEGIYQSTAEGKFITLNAAFSRMAGYESPEAFMKSVQDIGTQLYVHPEERKRFLEIREETGGVEKFEAEFYKKDGSTFLAVINARVVKDDDGGILYMEGLVEDITLRKQTEEQLRQTLKSLRKAVNTTINVMIAAIEMRDPYTAGHQKRSADFARAIATEMGLPPEKIDGIRMAGTIHDIGKLSIPAEILTKPYKLTNIELSLIKEHARSGYEILKDVESPWPLAEMVYQHHERMNGTGYPRNLKGDEILIEARILAVADVVEAMASHRPYRASLGIEAALEEIEKNKGILYDNVVVDTCLRLFRVKGYQLL